MLIFALSFLPFAFPDVLLAQSQPGPVANLNNLRYATGFAGADGGEKIAACIADLPSGGGTCKAQGLEGAQTIGTTITLGRPLRLEFGAATFTCTATPCFNITNPNVLIEGIPGDANSQGALSGTRLISASGGKLFEVDARLKGRWSYGSMRFKDMEWQGGGGTSQAISFPTQSVRERMIVFEGLVVHHFGAATGAIELGESVYFTDVNRCIFYNNVRSLSFANFDEMRVEFSEFYNPQGDAQIRLVGDGHAWIEDNEFMYMKGTGTGPDILVEPIDAEGTTGSYIRIARNKFGSDVYENSLRYKIAIQGSDASYVASGPIWVTENDFGGASNNLQKAIHLANPTGELRIEDNFFKAFGTLVDDTFALADAGSAFFGKNVFRGNHLWGNAVTTTAFTNGGRGFEVIEPPREILSQSTTVSLNVRRETVELRNRFGHSEDFDKWTKKGVTVTSGQTDPWGGTRARLLTRPGSASYEYVSHVVDNTNLTTTLFFRIWLKAGTLDNADIALFCPTDSKLVGRQRRLSLGTTWAEYRSAWNGLEAGKIYSVWIYPGGQVPKAGTISVFGAQASDFDSDYYPTSAGAASTSDFGTRLENGLLVGKGLEVGGSLTVGAGTAISKHLSFTFSLNLPAPAAVPGCVDSAIQTAPGVALGNTVVASLDAAPRSSQQLSAFVNAAGQVTFRVCQFAGNAADPDGAGTTYRADVWQH
ncbi:MAG: hypothetical protein LAO07_03550 [Acidobacteriia bacterium]|nr:hypothetical protein [Terriglobia bacterium]